MNLVDPEWHLKTVCPCCGQGTPVFVACPRCNFVTTRCDEMGDTFSDPKDMNKGFIDKCPRCNNNVVNFMIASSEQILNAGFTKLDYE